MKLKTLKEIKNLKNQRVLLRCDFNVPLKKVRNKQRVADFQKIEAVIPTIKTLQKQGAVVILASHLGAPRRAGSLSAQLKKELSLFPVADWLSKRLGQDILFVEKPLHPAFPRAAKNSHLGQIILLENLRFYPGEEDNNEAFAKNLSRLADIYVNDAFASCHREQASITSLPKYLPSYAGFNLERETTLLDKVLKNPHHPAFAIIGGAKISTKLPVIENLARRFDLVLIAGAVANNFLKAIGYEVGRSVVDKKYLESALKLLNHKTLGKKIIIPFDVRVGGGITSPRRSLWRQPDQVKKDEYILDIGPRTARLYARLARQAKLIVWNGPLGYYENKHFNRGTYRVARALSRSRAYSIIGGGETLDILKRLHLTRKIDFISTGGGALLEFLSGKELPGIKTLIKK